MSTCNFIVSELNAQASDRKQNTVVDGHAFKQLNIWLNGSRRNTFERPQESGSTHTAKRPLRLSLARAAASRSFGRVATRRGRVCECARRTSGREREHERRAV